MPWRRMIVPSLLLFFLSFFLSSPAVRAQTFQAVLTEGGKGGKNAPILGLGVFSLDKIAPGLPYSIQFRSDLFYGQRVAVVAGTVKKPGPTIFLIPCCASQSPIEGSFTPSLLIPSPDYGIVTWEDAIAAMWTGKTFLQIDTPHDADNLCGKITVVRR